MKCPHCQVIINFEAEGSPTWAPSIDSEYKDYGLEYGHCVNCAKLIVLYKTGRADINVSFIIGANIEVLYPRFINRTIAPEIPVQYQKDFIEACSVLSLSPKASAAISRRLLQNLLRQEFNIKKPNLAQEIEDFISRKDVPSYLADAIDAIRNIGNVAAHPLKVSNTGEIVEVEPGESEWLIEVIDSLFDFTFVQPKRLEERKHNLNQKLESLAKPPMKGSNPVF